MPYRFLDLCKTSKVMLMILLFSRNMQFLGSLIKGNSSFRYKKQFCGRADTAEMENYVRSHTSSLEFI